MARTSPLYRFLARTGASLVGVGASPTTKRGRSHAGRRTAPEYWEAWAAAQRRPGPLVWLHAPSVGEGLQAEAVITALRTLQPDWQVVHTHFSASAEPLAARLAVDGGGYIPYDLPSPVDRVLEALRPDALVFVKLDVWPELAVRAAARGVRVGLVAGTVSPLSGRTGWPVRPLIRPGYAALHRAGAIHGDDAERLVTLGVDPDRITVTGDPRADSVLARRDAVDPADPLLTLGGGRPALVAGSTWPADEAVLLEAFARVRATVPEARLILVPHEPTPAHVRGAVALAAKHGRRAATLSEPGTAWEVLVVDRVGVLMTLYGAGELAYVGGGFGRAGLHSVLEPAAWSRPVLFGPRWQGSRDAGLLIASGGAAALPQRDAVGALARQWIGWLTDAGARERASRAVREAATAGAGAAERSARVVEELVTG